MTLDGLVPPAIVAGTALVLLIWRRLVLKGNRPAANAALVCILMLVVGGLERGMGRPMTYRKGPVRFWSGDVASDQNSQQIADPYTFTHLTHGAAFYGLLWMVMRPASVGTRLLVATALEGAWEAYENTDTVVNRYRAATISIGYYGDSVINSVADIAACIVGFLLAWKLPRSATLAWVIGFEIMLALWIRDNLTLNILMLVYPIKAIKAWQSAAVMRSSPYAPIALGSLRWPSGRLATSTSSTDLTESGFE